MLVEDSGYDTDDTLIDDYVPELREPICWSCLFKRQRCFCVRSVSNVPNDEMSTEESQGYYERL